jgi:ABC transporter substrate binding protein (PQQ-dependent alcohol dehydrogenase system)
LISVNAAAVAQEVAPQPKPTKPPTEIKIGYLRAYEPTLALSVLDVPPKDLGIAGATVAMADNNTTGSFMGQKFTLEITDVKFEADVAPIFDAMLAKGEKYVLTDLSEKQLLAIADKARDAGVLLFNVGNTDDSLREENCRINVFHTAPTRSMLADGLAQYLVWKQWPKWALISGSHERDKLFAAALKRAAERFGGEIVAEKNSKIPAHRSRPIRHRPDSETDASVHQDLPDHDVLLVADEEVFGSYLPFRTWIRDRLPARPG